MASQQSHEPAAGPSVPGVEQWPEISAPASQSSHNMEFGTPSTSPPVPSRRPISTERVNASAPSRPISQDDHPVLEGDTRSRMRNTSPLSIQRHPENGEGPQPTTAAAPGSSATEAPTLPRPSVYRGSTVTRPRQSELDWIIPHEPKRELKQRTLQERIQPTINAARKERVTYGVKARTTGIALNAAIGCQVLLGALTTGLSVAISGKHASVATATLGGLSTIVASYLARQRGSKEPELSTMRCKDLDQFLRECDIFVLDYGHLSTNEHDAKLDRLRNRFEELLGNANGRGEKDGGSLIGSLHSTGYTLNY
ncbi:hypothetical protein GGX14DRAFT_634393 [Mycena pura]|uniref:SMODS and SLOG-associating 2TM effector domain-containing protein n=1 Tax=Mycena pura TaxID=153505 RepID=A0AAD6VI86_9AGAR|nr:hypothetical protein GGX14DRAFT_634393 [Mycena pura]